MALSNIAEWNDEKKTATACGASDNTEEKSTSCGA